MFSVALVPLTLSKKITRVRPYFFITSANVGILLKCKVRGGIIVSNQVLLWGTLIVPWLSLFFMPKDDIKRYMSAGLLGGFMSILVSEAGVANGWWYFRETTYPLAMMSSYTYGLFPIIPMWLFKYTYGRFGVYLAVDTVLNIGFAFFILPWLGSRGIIDFDAGLIVLFFESVIASIMYIFQIWQEGIFVRSEKKCFSSNLQSAAAKPLDGDEQDKDR